MTWTTERTPMHQFTCGACGTTVENIYLFSALEKVMEQHARLCPGFPPAAAPASPDAPAEEGT
jgi:hypothetical protein